MNIVTYYTFTHKKMYFEYFVPSVKAKTNFKIVSNEGVQHSEDGGYFSNGFNETTRDKITFLIENLQKCNNNEFILFSDVDVVFFKDITSYLNDYENYDMVFQNGYGGLNTGFFLVRNNKEVINLLIKVIENCHLFDNDQLALNYYIQFANLRYTMFDDRISCPATYIGPKIWTGENIEISQECLVFHACWCAGVDNKINLLDYVRKFKGI